MSALLTHSARAITDGWMAFLRILSSNYSIKFVIGENVPPATDGKTCWLPALPFELTKDDLTLFQSNGYHEIGHVMHSDISYFQHFARKHGDFGRFVLNAVDDVWMENKQAATVRRSAICFRKSIDLLYERRQFRDGSASPAEAVACYTLCFLGVQTWSEYSRPLALVTENFNAHFGDDASLVRQQLDELLLREFPNVQSTVDGGALALQVIELLKRLGKEDEQKRDSDPKKEDPQNSPDPQQRPDDSGGDSSEPATNGQKPEQSGKPSGSSDASGSAGSKSGLGQGSDDGEANGQRQTLSQIIEQIINSTELGSREIFDYQAAVLAVSESVEAGDNPDYQGMSNVPKCVIEGSVVPQPQKPGEAPAKRAGSNWGVDGIAYCPSDPAEAKQIVEKMGRKPQMLAKRLSALLMQQEEAEAFASMRGQLGEGYLHRTVLGDQRVFVQHDEVERLTTAVSLVVDLSRSTMDMADLNHAYGQGSTPTDDLAPSRLRSIIESAVLLETVLDQIGVPCEILGFAPRMENVLMSMVRSFGDDHQTATARLGGLRRVAGGKDTPIAEAVFHAGRRLAAHKANRKVMFVLTDGLPNDEEKAVEMTKYFERYGVRVVYLVIGDPSGTTWLANARIPFAQAGTCDEICPALLNKAAALLS